MCPFRQLNVAESNHAREIEAMHALGVLMVDSRDRGVANGCECVETIETQSQKQAHDARLKKSAHASMRTVHHLVVTASFHYGDTRCQNGDRQTQRTDGRKHTSPRTPRVRHGYVCVCWSVSLREGTEFRV